MHLVGSFIVRIKVEKGPLSKPGIKKTDGITVGIQVRCKCGTRCGSTWRRRRQVGGEICSAARRRTGEPWVGLEVPEIDRDRVAKQEASLIQFETLSYQVVVEVEPKSCANTGFTVTQ